MIKTLARCLGKYKKNAILAPILVSVEVLLEVFIPFLMSRIVDVGIADGDIGYILRIGLMLIVSAMLSLFFGMQAAKQASIAAAGFAGNVRERLYNNVQSFSFSNIDHFTTSSLVTRLTTDVTNVQNAFQMIVRTAVRSPVMLTFALIMSIRINPRLSLIYLAVIPFLLVLLMVIITRAHPIFERVFKTYDKLNNVVQENLRGIRVVKSFVREDHEVEKFSGVSRSIYKDFSKAERILAFNMPAMQFAIYTCMLLLSWMGANMIMSSTMTTGQLMSMITYTMQILMSLNMLGMVFVMIIISRASAQRIVEVLNEKSNLADGDAHVSQVPDGSICFKNVSFSYRGNGGRMCLKEVNLDIKSGETVGIIGGTGSAKSTLVQLIPRLYDATQGEILVGGIDVRDYDLKALRTQVAMVLQKNVLFSGTIKENLRWGDYAASDEEIARVCKLAQADEFIQSFPKGYDTYIEQGGTNVSGGQKQRLCIARALLMKPQILILDDSTSAVDTGTDALIRQAFREEIPDTTKLIIAQRIASVQDADKIIVMDGGRISAVGTHSHLMESSDIYREVYHSQVKGGGENGAA